MRRISRFEPRPMCQGPSRPPLHEALANERWRFITEWVELEELVRALVRHAGLRPSARSVSGLVEEAQLLDAERLLELKQLQRIRNELVHGIQTPAPGYLQEAAERLSVLTNEIGNATISSSEG
jgi:hypothetical protein